MYLYKTMTYERASVRQSALYIDIELEHLGCSELYLIFYVVGR